MKLVDNQNNSLSIRRQCELLGLYRSNYYYTHQPAVSNEDLYIMQMIDRINTKRPFFGVPRITTQLHKENIVVNHKRVYRLMQVMGIQAIYPKPNVSKSDPSHKIYPYLLKDLHIVRPNQVWGVDITYIRLKKEWLYLFAIIDWYSRYIVSWELSDNLGAWFCCEALQTALKGAIPEIHNSDQGSQFTDNDYIGILQEYPTIGISMDHRGRCFDNIFTERLWRTIKYEEVYLKEYESPREAQQNLREYITFYNEERFHTSLQNQTPEAIYYQKVH